MGDKTLHIPEKKCKKWCVRKIKNKIKYEPKNMYMLFMFLKTKHAGCQIVYRRVKKVSCFIVEVCTLAQHLEILCTSENYFKQTTLGAKCNTRCDPIG